MRSIFVRMSGGSRPDDSENCSDFDAPVTSFPLSWNRVDPRRINSPTFGIWRTDMRWMFAAACLAAISIAWTPAADAKGCIKGAIVGGVAGHMAGHGKAGAAAGCVIGHHNASKADADKANARAQAPSDQK
jgi:hypothetical protein